MWGNDEAIIEWFDEVRNRRAHPDKPGMETVPDAPPARNQLLEDLGL